MQVRACKLGPHVYASSCHWLTSNIVSQGSRTINVRFAVESGVRGSCKKPSNRNYAYSNSCKSRPACFAPQRLRWGSNITCSACCTPTRSHSILSYIASRGTHNYRSMSDFVEALKHAFGRSLCLAGTLHVPIVPERPCLSSISVTAANIAVYFSPNDLSLPHATMCELPSSFGVGFTPVSYRAGAFHPCILPASMLRSRL